MYIEVSLLITFAIHSYLIAMAQLYVDVKIPKVLANEIDKLVNDQYKGYRNRGEFVNDTIRRRLEEIETFKKLRAKYIDGIKDWEQ